MGYLIMFWTLVPNSAKPKPNEEFYAARTGISAAATTGGLM